MDDNGSTQEILLQKHRNERKQLLAEIQKLKHSIPKGDKKRQKEVTIQIAQLEAELDQQQEEELKDLEQQDSEVQIVSEGVEQLATEEGDMQQEGGINKQQQQPAKKSKAQKRREKKECDAREREERIKAGEVENLLGPRHLELKGLKEKLKARALRIHEIPSDGDCLYAAIAHQIQHTHTVDNLRVLAADYMRAHVDDFLPFLFLCNTDTGDTYTLQQFQEYCTRLEKTSEWGGHLEIQALSSCLQCPIEVIQSNAPSVFSGEQYSDKTPVVLTYHRHTYKLGEHYNAVVTSNHSDSEEEEHT